MARLIHPTAGTVVTLEGDLESRYRAAGWGDADAKPKQVEAPSEKPPRATSPRRAARSNK